MSCNLRGIRNKLHNLLARVWLDFLRMCGVAVTADGEYAPFGVGDDRRLDGVVAGLPDTVWEVGLDFTLTSIACQEGIAAGADADLGAAIVAEDRKRDKFEADSVRIGLCFTPVAHELTGAMGPAARDEIFMPALAVLKDQERGAEARAHLSTGRWPAPWNARSPRTHALQRMGP